MDTSLFYGLAGIPCFILFCCLLAYYNDIKKNIRYKMEKMKEIKKERQQWKQIVEKEKIEVQILAEARSQIYEENFQKIAPYYSNHAHTPVI